MLKETHQKLFTILESSHFKRGREVERERERERERVVWMISYLLMRMTIVVMMAARNTNPPNTPRAIIPPETQIYQ